MQPAKTLLVGGLVAVVAAGILWQTSRTSAVNAPAAASPGAAALPPAPRTQTPAIAAAAPSAEATPRSTTPAAVPNAASSPTETAPPPLDSRQAEEALMREMADAAYREQGSRIVDYFVSHGLARTDGERLVQSGIQGTVACWFDALRAQAKAESVPFDTVLYAVQAMFRNGDGPLLRGVIDMAAVSARADPCILNVLQETGIPAHVVQEIQRAAASR